MGPGISGTNRVNVSQPVSVGENTIETTVMFNHLLVADTGTYNCSAMIASPSSHVIVSDPAFGSESINVGRKCLGTDTKFANYLISSFL